MNIKFKRTQTNWSKSNVINPINNSKNKTVRILTIPLPANETLKIALSQIFGFGKKRIDLVLKKAKLLPRKSLKKLKFQELIRLRLAINYFRFIPTIFNKSILNNININNPININYFAKLNKNQNQNLIKINTPINNTLKKIHFFKLFANKWLLHQNLRLNYQQNIKDLILNRSFIGLRHQLKLPVRGQRSHANAKTVKRVRY